MGLNTLLKNMTQEQIAAIRKDYTLHALNEEDEAFSPFDQFKKWWEDAEKSDILEMNAMTLSTVSPEGLVDGRTVLLKGFDEQGFVFFTNYNSEKRDAVFI